MYRTHAFSFCVIHSFCNSELKIPRIVNAEHIKSNQLETRQLSSNDVLRPAAQFFGVEPEILLIEIMVILIKDGCVSYHKKKRGYSRTVSPYSMLGTK